MIAETDIVFPLTQISAFRYKPDMENTPLAKAVEIVGSTTKLAKVIDRRQSVVWAWVKRGWPSPDACLAIQEATGGKVSAADLLEPAMRKKADA